MSTQIISGFRALNQQELACLESLKRRQKVGRSFRITGTKVLYQRQGNFITAVVKTSGDLLRIGTAKFNPADQHFTEETGRQVSFVRALQAKGLPTK